MSEGTVRLICDHCHQEIVNPGADGWLEWLFDEETKRNVGFHIVHNFPHSPGQDGCTTYPGTPYNLQDLGLSLFLGCDGLKELIKLKGCSSDDSIERVIDLLHPRQHAYVGRIGDLLTVEIPDGGGVYFVAANETGRIKIGFTECFADRVRALRTSAPAPLRFVGCICGATKTDERTLHATFSRLRMPSTEWFTAADELIDRIVDEGWGETNVE